MLIKMGKVKIQPPTGGGATTFTGLTDTPSSYSGQSGKVVQVKATEDGLEFGTGGGATTFTGLTDTPDSYSGQGGKVVKVKSDESGLEFGTGGGATTFLDLTDTPSSYSGQGGKFVAVSEGEDELIFDDIGWTKAYETTVSMPPPLQGATTINITGLDGDDEAVYLLICYIKKPDVGDSPAEYGIRFNSDTGENYYSAYKGDPANSQDYITFLKAGPNENTSGYAFIYAKSGQVRAVHTFELDGITTSGWGEAHIGDGTWTNTSDNITSMQIYSVEGQGIGNGSHIILWKKAS